MHDRRGGRPPRVPRGRGRGADASRRQASCPVVPEPSNATKKRLACEKAAELRHSSYLPVTRAIGVCRQVCWVGKDEGVWPPTSSYACWHCAHTFPTSPVGIPVGYDERLNKWTLRGNYCSFNCAKASLRDQNRSSAGEVINQLSRLALYVHRCPAWDKPSHLQSKASFPGIKAAPPKSVLRMFGGWMSIDEFRENFWHVRAAYASELLVEWAPEMLATKVPEGGGGSRVTEHVQSKHYALQRSTPLFRHKTLDSYMKSGGKKT